MVDLLADIEAREGFPTRTRTSLLRALKSLRPASSSDEQLPQFNMRSLLRISDMNPPIYVCAILLLDARVEKEPSVIRERQEFQKLIDHLGLQSSSAKREIRNSHRASLVLLEVFIYMIIIDRARTTEEQDRVIPGSGMYEEEPLTG